jgi:hypothetical protein
MQRQSKVNKKYATACFLVLGTGMTASLAAGLTVSRRQVAMFDPILSGTEVILSAAEVVALRFPDELEAADVAQPVDLSAIEATARTDAGETLPLFNPLPTYQSTVPPPQAAPVAPATASVELASLTQVAPPPTASASQAQLTAAAEKLASAAAHRPVNTRPGALLSDGQIANIKQRLKLTPDQQQMWPAVETALRNLNYSKKADGAHRNGSQDGAHRVATLDTDSAEVQHLTSAAFPLIMSFSDDQKRELHVLAHVAGLEQLVPKF